ncbi:hypothetical protein EEB19_02980 [Gordonia sp. OPL2]|nr:hypothetical protein EEB19_02980 [Gordonia sp. OPL2]
MNRTGQTAYAVSAASLDDAADAWHAARPPYAPDRHASVTLETEVPDGEDVGGWRFIPGPNALGTVEIRWSDVPGGPLANAVQIDVERGLESHEISGSGPR